MNKYKQGKYFSDPLRHSSDAQFKIDNLIKLLLPILISEEIKINSIADVGCGSGKALALLYDELKKKNYTVSTLHGYDISPHVVNIEMSGIEFRNEDFTESNEYYDLILLLDVFEHVIKPIEFISNVAGKGKLIAFHIPLDNSIFSSFRNLYIKKINRPGHLIFMDAPFALNILCLSGIEVITYKYTYYNSPDSTVLQKIMSPLRKLMFQLNPWLLSKTLGGPSLMVLGRIPNNQRII
jgi:SAM-dependent methyltransferase